MPDALTITDNRTGKLYEIPIADGAIRATDLRQIKVDKDDQGLGTYDPAFMNTASCRSRITYIDGDKGILEYRGYLIEQLAEQSTYLGERRISSSSDSCRPTRSSRSGPSRSRCTMLHENIKKLMEGFHATPIR